MKKYQIFILVLGFVVLPSLSIAGDLPNFPFVSSKGRAEKMVKPDKATLHIRIEAYDKQSETALNKANSALQKVVTILRKHKIKDSQIEASDWSKSVKRKRNDNYELLQILGYELSRSLTIELMNLESYPVLVVELSALDYVASVSGRFDVSNREEIVASLLEDAAKNAKDNAEKSAAALGSEIQSVYAINTYISPQFDDSYGYPLAKMYAMRDRAPSEMMVFIPQEISVSNQVSVVFRLKE